jgi:hypothetical protein
VPNVPINYSGGSTVKVVSCPNARNYIEVLGFRLTAGVTNTAEWDSQPIGGGSPTTQDGPYQVGPDEPIVVGQNQLQPVFALPPGADLYLTTTAASAVSGGVTYAIRQNAGGGPYN